MRRLWISIFAGGFITVVAGGGWLVAQQATSRQGGEAASTQKPDMGMMKNMSGPMKLKAQMMMQMEVMPTDPAALLAVDQQLGLSEQQSEKLKQILAAARTEARQLLQVEQREKLQGLADLPATHMAMHQMMMKKKMNKQDGTDATEDAAMRCPMMQAMQGDAQMSDMKEKMREKKRMMMEKMNKSTGQGEKGHGGDHEDSNGQ